MAGVFFDLFAGLFKHGIGLLSGHGGKLFEETADAVAEFEMGKKRADGDARAGEAGGSAEDLLVDLDGVHDSMIAERAGSRSQDPQRAGQSPRG